MAMGVTHQFRSRDQPVTVASRFTLRLQRKATTQDHHLIERDDRYESEADGAADHVMRMPAPVAETRASCGCSGSKGADGRCTACQLKRSHSAPDRLANWHGPAGDGQPLDHSTLDFFESRFGHDFSQVRVHSDARAAESAEAVDALAYTLGSDIVFGEGSYRPATDLGRRLIAHELAHVIQQQGKPAIIQRKEKEKTPCSVHAYDAADPEDRAVIPKDGTGIGVKSVADMVAKVNAYVSDEKNACSCISRLEINGHGGNGRQHVGTAGSSFDADKIIAHNSTDEHLNQLTNIKFCARALFMLMGCHVGRGDGKTLLSRLAHLLPGKLIGGAQHYTTGVGLGKKKVFGAGDDLDPKKSPRDPFLTSPHVRWHLVIDDKEYVIPGNETTTSEGKSKLKAAKRIKVKTPDGVEVIK